MNIDMLTYTDICVYAYSDGSFDFEETNIHMNNDMLTYTDICVYVCSDGSFDFEKIATKIKPNTK